MDDLAARVLIVAGVVAIAVVATLLARRFGSPHHVPVDLTGLGLPSGIVIFTSTTCANCKEALARVRGTGAPVREVTHEIEEAKFEAAGVSGVPLTVIVDDDGRVVDQIAGVPRPGRLQRSLRRAGLATEPGG